MTVSCVTCMRREVWSDGDREVVMEGGSRRPAEHPTLAAWLAIRRGVAEGRSVVGTCVCGQPLLGSGAGIPWTLETPEGPIEVVNGEPTGLSISTLEEKLQGWFGWKLELEPAMWLFRGTVFMSVIAPVVLWMAALTSVIVFLIGIAYQGLP